MQFQVPQFIETEDRIVGPFTFRQFAVIAAFSVVIALLFFVLRFGLWLFVAAVLGSTALGLALGKINGRPMTVYLGALYESVWKPRVYVFKPEIPGKKPLPKTPPEPRAASPQPPEPKLQPKEEPVEQTIKTPEVPGAEAPALPKIPKIKTSAQKKEAPARPAFSEFKPPSLGGIKGLREWIATSKTAIPKREKPLPRDFGAAKKRFKDRYEVVRYLTGERELAKRVDYR